MRKLNLGTGVLVGALLTAALMGIMYLGRQLFGFPFVPYELFNWVARVLPGDLVTFGIDLMIDTMLFLGISVVDSAKTAERAMAIIQFLLGGALAGLVYFAVMKARQLKASHALRSDHGRSLRLANDSHQPGHHPIDGEPVGQLFVVGGPISTLGPGPGCCLRPPGELLSKRPR